MRFLLLHGPNLNLLGSREPEVYGSMTLAELEETVRRHAAAHDVEVVCLQSNHEGVLIDAIQAAPHDYEAIIYNPGAHAHYSYALRDAIAAISIPVAEVHLTAISEREEFRRTSVLREACAVFVEGRGVQGYLDAFDRLKEEMR